MCNDYEQIEYQAIAGHQGFRDRARALLLGADNAAIKSGRAQSVQAISGTGALSLGGDFLVKFFPKSNVYLPDPTWPNHPQTFARSGTKNYRYWDEKTRGLDFKGMVYHHITITTTASNHESIIQHCNCLHNLIMYDGYRLKISVTLQQVQSSYYTRVLTTQQVLTLLVINGVKSLMSSRPRITSPSSTVHIKALPLVT
jgi:hypothetical protein